MIKPDAFALTKFLESSREVSSRFVFRATDDGILVFDLDTGETLLLPAAKVACREMLEKRLGSDPSMLDKLLAKLNSSGFLIH